MDQIAFLTQRVWRLEQEVEQLKGSALASMETLYAPPRPTPESRQAEAAAAPPTTPRPAAAPVVVAPRPPELEAELVGTWFARIGAVALLIGAGFAFKYGIDRGLIGPGLRVVIGVVAGVALIAGSEWSRRRDWPVFAQAIAAAGAGLMFLSFWAGYHLYDLIPAPATFLLLVGVTVTTAALSLRHDSQALAVLATVGGFLAPLLVGGRSRPVGLFGYLLVLDAGILAVSTPKRWVAPPLVAFFGTWLLFGTAADDASLAAAFGYATAIFVLFAAGTAVLARDVAGDEGGAALVALNGAAYFAAGVALLSRDAEMWRGAFAAALGALHLWGGATAKMTGRGSAIATTGFALGQVFLAAAVPLQLHGNAIPVAWAIEAVLFVWIGSQADLKLSRPLGFALLLFSSATLVLGRFEGGSAYNPDQLLVSDEALAFVVHILAYYVMAAILWRSEERQGAVASVVAANVVTVVWLSFEAFAQAKGPFGDVTRNFPFTLSAIWGLYAALQLAIGVAMRWRGARLMGITLLAVTIVKMALVDLWLLETGYRVLAFLGLGVILLTVSLTYHRFREFIIGPEPSGEESHRLADEPTVSGR